MNLIQKTLLCGMVSFLAACTSSVYNNVSCSTCKQNMQEEEINLSADALFVFDRYKERHLLPKGRLTLDDLANKLVNNYVEVQQVSLIGHTDRMGSYAYNDKLSLNRAKTVRSYLKSHGVNTLITVDGRGEHEPVTNGCYHLKGPKETSDGREMTRVSDKLRACLQPDRRVTVRVLGIKKIKPAQCAKEE